MLSPMSPLRTTPAAAAGSIVGMSSGWPREDPITVSTTIEEEGYAPITVEGAVLSLFLDRLEVCVPQTKFTISIYLRDVFRLAPWEGAVSDGGHPALTFHTGVFAPRRYIIRASGRSSSTSLKMLYDLLKMKIIPRDPPNFPIARSVVHETLATRYFGPRDDAANDYVPPPTHLEWPSRPAVTGGGGVDGDVPWFDQRKPSSTTAAVGVRSEVSTPWMMSRSQSVVAGAHVAARHHHAVNLEDIPAAQGGRRKPPVVADATDVSVGMHHHYGAPLMSTPSAGLSRVASGVLETPTAGGGAWHGTGASPRPPVAVISCGVQTVENGAALPAVTPSRSDIVGPPEGPVVAPPPPLWLLQRNLVKMEEQEQLLHRQAPRQRKEGYDALLDLANATYASHHHQQIPCEINVERGVYASYVEDCKRNEFKFTADSPPPPHPRPAALEGFLQPQRHAAAPPAQPSLEVVPAQPSLVALAEERLQAKRSLAALHRKVSTRQREDVMVAIESEASTPSSPRRLAIPIQRAATVTNGTPLAGRQNVPTARHQSSNTGGASRTAQEVTPQQRQSWAVPSTSSPPAAVDVHTTPPQFSAPPVPAAIPSPSPPAVDTPAPDVVVGPQVPETYASNHRPMQKVYTGIPHVASSVVSPPDRTGRAAVGGTALETPSSLAASIASWDALAIDVPQAPPPRQRSGATGEGQPAAHVVSSPALATPAAAASSRSESRASVGPVVLAEAAAVPAAAASAPPPVSRPMRQGIPMPHLQAQGSSTVGMRRPTLDGAPELLRRVGTVR